MGAFRELDLDGKAARLNEAGGRLTYRFRARDVHLVMGPADPGGPVRFRVQIDETRREPRAGSTSVIAAGDSLGSAPLPTRPPARSGRRAHLRDHVPRARSRSVCVHLRLDTTREPCHGFTSGKGDLHDDHQRATFRDQDSHVAPDRRPDPVRGVAPGVSPVLPDVSGSASVGEVGAVGMLLQPRPGRPRADGDDAAPFRRRLFERGVHQLAQVVGA